MNTLKNKEKVCVLILVYFGRFNNYYPLFLKSCAMNPGFDWFIFTDNVDYYDYPENVFVIQTTLDEVRVKAREKFGFEVVLDSPHKLCDYKPAYGLLFENYIVEYKYWGYCDCDLIFGNLEQILLPLLNEGYDKLFAAGHLTLYRNTYDNNRRFMKDMNGRYLYREAYTTNDTFVLDEDWGGHDNVHTIFLMDGCRVYENDLCMNPAITSARFMRDYYCPELHEFVKEKYKKARYFWIYGNIFRLEWNGKIICTEYLYIHLQRRKMRVKCSLKSPIIEILPDRFIDVKRLPRTKWEVRFSLRQIFNLYWYDVYLKKLERKILKCIDNL